MIAASTQSRIHLKSHECLLYEKQRVADLCLTICFPHSSLLSSLDYMYLLIDPDPFRFHVHKEFEANCGMRGDLYGKLLNHLHLTCLSAWLFRNFNPIYLLILSYNGIDIVGHMKLLNGQSPTST